MSDSPRKLRFEDLQPHVDMLCDALENRGASSSGLSYNQKIYQQAVGYKNLLKKIRNKEITGYDLEMMIHTLGNETIEYAKGNQQYRIYKIVKALEIFLRKEFNKLN